MRGDLQWETDLHVINKMGVSNPVVLTLREPSTLSLQKKMITPDVNSDKYS